LDESFGDSMQVTILATGFENEMPESDIAERPSHEARSFGSEDTGFERPAYLAKGDGGRSSYSEADAEEEEEETVAAEPTSPKGRRLGRLGERSDVLPAIFGTGL